MMKKIKWPDTIEEYDAMTREERSAIMVEFMMTMATLAGVHKTCRLPKCRRAKACATVERPGSWASSLGPVPVCILDNANHSAMVKAAYAFSRQHYPNACLD